MLKASNQSQLDDLVTAVLTSANYKHVSPDLVRNIASQELMKRRNLKDALKATKNKLHQVGGAYLDGRDDYSQWLNELKRVVQVGNQNDTRQVCKKIMSHHASTRERLPILDQFYTSILADLTPVHSILDLACGLNPLTLPWIPLAAGGHYYAYDIYQHIIDFLQKWLLMIQTEGHAQVCDLTQSYPTHPVDVALVLKTIPCLEQVDKQAGSRLLRSINARHLVVSFPIHSLGGKSKGMAMYYEAHFQELVEGEKWNIKKIEFATELVFVVTK